MLKIEFNKRDVDGLKRAIKRNPTTVRLEAHKMFVRINATLMSSVISSPWQVGGTGGGVPVKTRNLKESIRKVERPYEARIWVNEDKAPYGVYVHEGTYKMKARPWFDYAVKTKKSKIDIITKNFLTSVVKDLGK